MTSRSLAFIRNEKLDEKLVCLIALKCTFRDQVDEKCKQNLMNKFLCTERLRTNIFKAIQLPVKCFAYLSRFFTQFGVIFQVTCKLTATKMTASYISSHGIGRP